MSKPIRIPTDVEHHEFSARAVVYYPSSDSFGWRIVGPNERRGFFKGSRQQVTIEVHNIHRLWKKYGGVDATNTDA